LQSQLEIYIDDFGEVCFGVACKQQSVIATTFAENEPQVRASLSKIVNLLEPIQVASETSVFAKRVLGVLRKIYEGKDVNEKVPLSLAGLPNYTQRVLEMVSQIPVGYVCSYGGVAEAAGGGARAVGNVMAANRFAPIVPCHRVVTSSLGLGGYGGGLRTKLEFLRREKRGYVQQNEVLVGCKKLQVFPVEFVLSKYSSQLTV